MRGPRSIPHPAPVAQLTRGPGTLVPGGDRRLKFPLTHADSRWYKVRTMIESPLNPKPTHTTRSVRQRAGRLVRDAVRAASCAIVADRLGVGRPTCHRWATGARLPHAMYARHILEVLS